MAGRGLYAVLLFGYLLLVCGSAQAAIVPVNGANVAWQPISGTTNGFTATGYVDGLNQTVPNAFSDNWAILNQDVIVNNKKVTGEYSGQSAATALSLIPALRYQNHNYFVFVFDSQETQQNMDLILSSVSMTVVATNLVAWQMTDEIHLNATAPYTNTPLGNGGDMALLVPVRAFLGLRGSNTIIFRAGMRLGNNGFDEWELNSSVYPNMFFFGNNEYIYDTPEPATWFMVITGSIMVFSGALRRRFFR